MLRQRLEDTQPGGVETRNAFLVRLRRTVHWLNLQQEQEALDSCRNQKQRARDVQSNDGHRTDW